MASVAVCVLWGACEPGMNERLGRVSRDPFEDIPVVRSFAEEYTILVRWNEDEAADEYYLYRAADDSVAPQYTLVYCGALRNYADRFVLSQAGERYVYRLGKRRGSRLFVDLTSPGKAGLGVVSADILEATEPNNTEPQATVIKDTALPAAMYFYESNATDGLTLYDEDWYCVDIPAHWKAQIKIDDAAPPPISSQTWYTFAQRGFPSQEITTTTPVEIANTTNEARRYVFRIFPNYALFRGMTAYAGGCGKFVYYTVRVLNLQQ
jgi:hypothetical protein